MKCLTKSRRTLKKPLVVGVALVCGFWLCFVVVRWDWKTTSLRGHRVDSKHLPVKIENGPLKKTNKQSVEVNNTESPTLEDRSLYKVRLTRLGSELSFDYSTCPADSLARNGTLRNYSEKKSHRCPKLFIVGAKKGGTTSLYNYTAHHPDFQGIRLTNVTRWFGETQYFSRFWDKVPLTEYLSQFPRDKMSGDASVEHLVHCKVPSRIFTTCGPDVKVVVLLRDPIERCVQLHDANRSQWLRRLQSQHINIHGDQTRDSHPVQSSEACIRYLNGRLEY